MNMKIEEYIKTMDPTQSYWLIEAQEMKPLNDVRATAENLWVVFVCGKCSSEKEREYHAVPYTKIVKDSDGDFLVYCPTEGNTDDPNDWEDYIRGSDLPPVLEEIFAKTTFRNVSNFDDSCDEEEDDFWDDYEDDSLDDEYDAEDEEAYADGDDDILCENDCEDDEDTDDAESER